jgi:hypothetical protein
MRQEQAMVGQYLAKRDLHPNPTARRPAQDELRQLADRARLLAESHGDLTDVAIDLAALLYQINAVASLNGIDLEPFVDCEHSFQLGSRLDLAQLQTDVALMTAVSEKEQIQRLLDRDDLGPDERGQVETCAHLHRAGIPLRWPQRVALARIESVCVPRAAGA